MAQIMNALKQSSALNWRKYGKPLDHLDLTEIKALWLHSGCDKPIWRIKSYRQTAWRTMDKVSWHSAWDSDQEQSQEK